jgi:polyferredoxin
VSYRALIRLRRLSQGLSLALFLLFADAFLRADPLAALTSALATRTLYKGLLWSLVIALPTVFLGRVFCGWVCPLGTLNHWVSSWKSETKRGRARLESNRYKSWHRSKDYLLAALLAAALFGSALAGLLDPLSLTVRSLWLSAFPGMNYAENGLLAALYNSDWSTVRYAGDVLNFILHHTVMNFEQPHFRQGFFLGLIFLGILALNLRVTRFWCRAICPLGALLGWMSRWSVLGLEKRPGLCDDCNRCLLNCQGGDDPIPGARWHKSECHVCLNCVGDCPAVGLRFTLFPALEATVEGPNLERRKALAGLAAGTAALPLLRSTPGLAAERDDRLVRPPGALDEKLFLERCIRCGNCMKVCPNNALHPALTQAGWEGVWTPVLVARIGYCEPSCVLCGEQCPTGAIWEFTQEQKGWTIAAPRPDAKPIRIGTAFYDHGRCLPWSMATECIVCEEWCPTAPKAVYLRSAEVVDAEGNAKQVRQPYIDPSRCVGCGACEYACPVHDRPAVYVTSIGESRSRANQLLLKRSEGRAVETSPFPASGEVAGWTRGARVRTFQAEDLWKYIDGAADRYVEAGVVRTVTAEYRFQDRVDATADVYIMKSAEGASKLFEAESAKGSKPLAVGDAGRLYKGSIVFRQGASFVRIVALGDCPAEALIALATGIGRRIETGPSQ